MILLYWKDLLLKSRMKEFAANSGVRLTFAKNLDELNNFVEQGGFNRAIIDLTGGPEFAKTVGKMIGSRLETIGVFSHVDTVTEAAALESGFSAVIPRSVLVKQLAVLLDPAQAVP